MHLIGASSNLSTEDEEISDEDSDEDMIYIEIGEILEKRPATRSFGSRQITVPVHRRCVCHLLNLISKADVDKIQHLLFKELRTNVEAKLQSLWNKQSSSSNNSDIIRRHLGKLFILKNETRWNTWYLRMCGDANAQQV